MIFNIIFLLLLLGLISIPTLLRLWKKKQKKESALYASLMGLATLIGILLLTDIHLPSPSDPLRYLFQPIGELIFKTTDNNKLHQE